MSKAHSGSRLILKNQIVPVQFDTAHFNFQEDATGIQYGQIIHPTVTPVYSSRRDGIFGNCIAIEEGTTNLVDNGDFANEKTGWGSWDTSTITVTDVDFFGDTVKAINLVKRADGTTTNAIHKAIPGLTVGTNYTLSMYARISPSCPISSGSFNIYINSYVARSVNKEWNRIEITQNASSTSHTIHMTQSNSNIDIQIAFVQVEAKSFSTSFVNGTRANGKIALPPLLSGASGTVSFWATFQQDYNSRTTGGWARIIDQHPGSNVATNKGVVLRCSVLGSDVYMKLILCDGTTIHNTTTTFVPQIGLPYFISFSYKSGEQHIYIGDSILGFREIGSSSNILVGDIGTQPFKVGWGNSADIANALFSELRVDNAYYETNEIRSWYESQAPFYNPYDTRAYAY